MNHIKSLIFDFDGLILDTETPQFEVWSDIFSEYGAEISIQDWALCLGTSADAFDTVAHLQKQIPITIDRNKILTDHTTRSLDKINISGPLPGIVELLEYARNQNLAIGLASSSPRNWVMGHLTRLNLQRYFDCILCQEDVVTVKPAPDLYNAVLNQFLLDSGQAVAFEDSPNGITAACRAGIFCIGVPNPVSQYLNISHADYIIPSLDVFPPSELINIVQRKINARNKEI